MRRGNGVAGGSGVGPIWRNMQFVRRRYKLEYVYTAAMVCVLSLIPRISRLNDAEWNGIITASGEPGNEADVHSLLCLGVVKVMIIVGGNEGSLRQLSYSATAHHLCLYRRW